MSLHGGKEQIDRDYVLSEFKQLIKPVMIATGVAGRGLDVPEIVCVINYSCPDHMEDYIHRVGRTGRAGRRGTAYTFISESEAQYSGMCMEIHEAIETEPSQTLIALHDAYLQRHGKTSKRAGRKNGFTGKGFKFDATEMSASQKMAAVQQRNHALETGESVGAVESLDVGGFDDVGIEPQGHTLKPAPSMTSLGKDGFDTTEGSNTGIGNPLADSLERARVILQTKCGHLDLPLPTLLDTTHLTFIPIATP